MQPSDNGKKSIMTCKAIYRHTVAALKSIKIFFVSFNFWPAKQWLRFWLSRKEDQEITLNGLKFLVRSANLSSKIVDLYMITGCVVEQQYTSAPNFSIGEKDTVIDIGTHIGGFSIYAAGKAKQGRIFGFEPDPDNYGQLLKNISLNRLSNITAVPKAVCSENKQIVFYKDAINSAMNSVLRKTGDRITVECINLAEIFKNFNLSECNFLKIDCEGAEYEIILKTPAETLKKIKRIVIEYHSPEFFNIEDKGYTAENLIKHLERSGFHTRIEKENAIQGLIWAWR
jgi:FkbM family methyltransferase